MEEVNEVNGKQEEVVAVVEPAPAVSPVAEQVEAWFRRTMHDSVVSRNTEVFNYVRESVDALKTELAG